VKELYLRIISGIIIAGVFILSFQFEFFYFTHFLVLIEAVSLVALVEYYNMFLARTEDRFIVYTGLFMTTIIILGLYFSLVEDSMNYSHRFQVLIETLFASPSSVFPLLFFAFFAMAMHSVFRSRVENGFYPVVVGIAGLLYITIPVGTIFMIRKLENGLFFVWLVSWVTVMSDTFGYISGKLFGRHKLKLSVSPNKTVEGYIGAFILTALSTFGVYRVLQGFVELPHIGTLSILLFSLVFSLLSMLGDLTESMVKRNANAKDTGSILPGHGGILDRIDSFLFTLPAFYYLYPLFIG